jgi:hypothetical protein
MTDLASIARAPWTDGVDSTGLWTYSGPYGLGRVSHRNDRLWGTIVLARKALIAKAVVWHAAAIADGWNSRPTYSHEPEEQAFTLSREGFLVQGLARPCTSDTVGSGQLTCWGPDGLSIPVGEIYDWPAIQAGLTTCENCGTTGVETFRAAFVNRGCADCLPAMKAALETPGWNA